MDLQSIINKNKVVQCIELILKIEKWYLRVIHIL